MRLWLIVGLLVWYGLATLF